MAKNNFLESANGIQKTTKELLERLTLTQSSVGELLVSVRHSESELLEKEEQKRKAREERERMERLRDLLDSDQDHSAHAGGRDDDELPPQPQQRSGSFISTNCRPGMARKICRGSAATLIPRIK